MAEYQKINTLFKRDSKNIIIPSQFTLPEFDYLKDNIWECTEKIDGTNIRIELLFEEDKVTMQFKGRTEAANIPAHLVNKLYEIFDGVTWREVFPTMKTGNITIYGEGYGAKIQKGGGNYISNGVNFILFDVKVGEWWLNRASLEEIAEKLDIQVVPLIGYFTIDDAIKIVKKGFKSHISENLDFIAEGLVLKPIVELHDRKDNRIITKLKTKDFEQYEKAKIVCRQ